MACCAVSDEPAVKAKIRSFSEAGSFVPYFSRINFAQTRLAARNFAISGKKSMFEERNVKRVGATKSTETPRAIALSKYSRAFANVKATSCTALDPASRMW